LLTQEVNEKKEKIEREKRALAVNHLLGLVPVSPSPTLTFSLVGNLQSVQHYMSLTRNMEHLSPEFRNNVMARLEGSLRQIQRFR